MVEINERLYKQRTIFIFDEMYLTKSLNRLIGGLSLLKVNLHVDQILVRGREGCLYGDIIPHVNELLWLYLILFFFFFQLFYRPSSALFNLNNLSTFGGGGGGSPVSYNIFMRWGGGGGGLSITHLNVFISYQLIWVHKGFRRHPPMIIFFNEFICPTMISHYIIMVQEEMICIIMC